jgi:negative regulator of sigma E activity
MESSINDKKLESYLRNELSDIEIAALEDQLLRDDELYQRLETLQMNLIDRYLEDEMSDDEKRHFEITFLSIPANQWKLEEAQIVRESLRLLREKQPATRKVVRFPDRFFQRAAAAVVLIVIAVVVILFATRWQNRVQNNLSTQIDPTPPVKISITPTPQPSPSPSPSPTPPQRKTGPPIEEEWLYIKESRTGVAGSEDDLHIKTLPDTETLRLRFELLDDARALTVLRVSIKDQMDHPVLGPLNLTPGQFPYRGSLRRAISLDVPISILNLGERYSFEIAELPPPKTFVITR